MENQVPTTSSSLKNTFSNILMKVLKLLIVIIVLGAVSAWGLTQFAYSEGERAGVVSKFSKKGYVFKTYEGELNVGAQGQVSNMNQNIWAFTLQNSNDTAIINNLEDAMLYGKRVRLHYEQRVLKFFWMGDSEFFVTRVDVAK
jgi:hypothetical protein